LDTSPLNLLLLLLLLICCSGCILLALVIFGMATYASGIYPVGSIDAVWANLQKVVTVQPVANNK
jgi:hypothetical protein